MHQHYTRLYIIAGEPSGDRLGARLMKAFKKHQPNLIIKGIGGIEMQQNGLESLFNIQFLSIMGLEAFSKLFDLYRLLQHTIQDIAHFKPDIILTIDSPGFTKRVIQKLQTDPNIFKIHYVAPSVWAWKPGRAIKYAKLYDLLLCILPFEPKYFISKGLDTHFIGHPICTQDDLIKARKNAIFDPSLIALIPGSRHGEIKRHLPLMLDFAAKITKQYPYLRFIIPTLPTTTGLIDAICETHNLSKSLKIDKIPAETRFNQLANARLAIVASGSVALELAFLNIATIILYKISIISTILTKLLVKSRYAHILNIVADQQIVPELLREKANLSELTQHTLHLLEEKNAIAQIENLKPYMQTLNAPQNEDSADLAIKIIFEKFKKHVANQSK
ncbi:MAG: lipid-A-disaccharide synthase [Pseudomonadota bacterium]